MKNKIFKILCISSVVCLSGCGISQEKHTLLQTEHTSLQQEHTLLQEENNLLEEKYDTLQEEHILLEKECISLQEEVDFYKNGSDMQLVAIKNAFENKDYNKVITLSDKLHNSFNGTPQDSEGLKLAQQSQTILNQIEEEKRQEEERLALEAEKTAQDKAREIIRVHKLSVGEPNSAGGVDLFIGYTNKSDKTIKYATFTVTPYNKVGDKAYCDITNDSTFNAQDQGPHEQGQGIAGNYNWYWECAWYNWTINSVVLEKIYIQYMDGTTKTLSGKDIEYVMY